MHKQGAHVGRPTHSIKELEALLKWAETQGWAVTKDGKYFKMKCPCAAKHMKTVKCTPKIHYENSLRRVLNRTTCWKDET